MFLIGDCLFYRKRRDLPSSSAGAPRFRTGFSAKSPSRAQQWKQRTGPEVHTAVWFKALRVALGVRASKDENLWLRDSCTLAESIEALGPTG